MFGYSMVQMVRTYADKMDRPLREEILNLYKPFKLTPCIFHHLFEGMIKRNRKLSVILEFEKGCYEDGCKEINGIIIKFPKNRVKQHFPRISCTSAQLQTV